MSSNSAAVPLTQPIEVFYSYSHRDDTFREELEKHLQEIQPEISQIVNQVTRDALKQKAQQMGTVTEISEDAESGSLTIKVEV